MDTGSSSVTFLLLLSSSRDYEITLFYVTNIFFLFVPSEFIHSINRFLFVWGSERVLVATPTMKSESLQQGYFNIFGGAMICVPLSNNKRVTLL
jgi:hypothetical protein